MSLRSLRSLATSTVLLATTALVTGLGATAASAATAAPGRTTATGATTATFNATFLKAFVTSSCGAVTATGTGGARTVQTAKKAKGVLPVTAYTNQDDQVGRIEHAGSGVTLTNSCGSATLTDFTVGNLANPSRIDVAVGGTGSQASPPLFTVSSTPYTGRFFPSSSRTLQTVKPRTLQLTAAGAAGLNNLATGNPFSGPFAQGQVVGSVTLKVTIPYVVDFPFLP